MQHNPPTRTYTSRVSTLRKNQSLLRSNNYNTPPDLRPSDIDKDYTRQSTDIQLTLEFVSLILKYVCVLNNKNSTCY